MKKMIFMAIWILTMSPVYAAIGIDCEKAQSQVERMICDVNSNPTLWSLDSEMNTFYDYLLRESNNKQKVINTQKKWLIEVRDVCLEGNCLRKAYELRIAQLQQATTMCKAREIAVFSCVMAQKKMASLCASQDVTATSGYIKFRLGRNQSAPEIELPKQEVSASNYFKYYSWESPKASTHALSFWNGEFRYSLFYSRATHGYNGAGVILSRGKPPIRVSFEKCVSEPAVFSEYGRYSSISFFKLGDNLDLPEADGDISTYGPATDANFGKNLEDGPPKPGERELSPQ